MYDVHRSILDISVTYYFRFCHITITISVSKCRIHVLKSYLYLWFVEGQPTPEAGDSHLGRRQGPSHSGPKEDCGIEA